jgi:hypothetical protein
MKRYGIRITLPPGDTLRAAHLLGGNWEAYRWFETQKARDNVLADMQSHLAYNRRGDSPTQILEKIDE